MLIKIKSIMTIGFCVFVLGGASYATEITSATQAINIAGKQRMFTQRMLKNYAMIGMENIFGNPKKDLRAISSEFEEALGSLYEYSKNEDTKKSLEKVKLLWAPLRKILSEDASKDKVRKLQEDLEILLKATDDTTMYFSKELGYKEEKIVNISGRQRMLSQRMASLYMLEVWGVSDPHFRDKMLSAMDLFKISLAKLKEYELNTEEITKLLAKVERAFVFFEMMSRSKSKFIPTLIYKKSNDILKNMEKITQAYVVIKDKEIRK